MAKGIRNKIGSLLADEPFQALECSAFTAEPLKSNYISKKVSQT